MPNHASGSGFGSSVKPVCVEFSEVRLTGIVPGDPEQVGRVDLDGFQARWKSRRSRQRLGRLAMLCLPDRVGLVYDRFDLAFCNSLQRG